MSDEKGGKIEELELLGYHHENQFDCCITMPLEFYLPYGEMPHRNRAEVYLLNAKLGLNFLDRAGLFKEEKDEFVY